MKKLILTLTFVSVFVTMETYADKVAVTARKRPYLNDMVIKERLLWQRQHSNKYSCLGECARDDKCCSIFYNKDTNGCQGHSVTFGLTSGAESDLGTVYYVRPHGEDYIGDSCLTSSDCVTINSECRDDMCLCIPGYSFSPRTHECLAGCSAYGSDFLEVRDHFISQTNNDVFSTISFDDCSALCLNRTEYECVTFEYGRDSGNCYLSNATKLEWPGSWFPDLNNTYNISYYQRDCV